MGSQNDGHGNGQDEDDLRRQGQFEDAVSDLVVKVNEPDVYTPTLDLSGRREEPEGSFSLEPQPGLRRVLRTNAEDQLELALAAQDRGLKELRGAIDQYEKEERKLWPWVWGLIAFLVALGIVILLGHRT